MQSVSSKVQYGFLCGLLLKYLFLRMDDVLSEFAKQQYCSSTYSHCCLWFLTKELNALFASFLSFIFKVFDSTISALVKQVNLHWTCGCETLHLCAI